MTSSPSPFTDLRVSATRESELVFHARIRSKLKEAFGDDERPPWWKSFGQCGKTLDCGLWCLSCGEWHEMKHKCSIRWCPICAWRVTEKRKIKLKLWSRAIPNPMHLILTQKNFEVFDRPKFRQHYQNLTKIRRMKVFRQVRGGCVSVEVTNKTEGWHLHSHWLIDARFVDMKELSVKWGKLCGQEFGIVKYKKPEAEGQGSYVNEVCKYICKGSDLVTWCPSDIRSFVETIYKSRNFYSFGTILGGDARVKAMLNEIGKRDEKLCDRCGLNDLHFIPDRSMSTDRRCKFISL